VRARRCAGAACRVSCSPAAVARCRGFLRPPTLTPDAPARRAGGDALDAGVSSVRSLPLSW
jgi:hypothetical protein